MKSYVKHFSKQFEEQYSSLSELPVIGLAEIPKYKLQYDIPFGKNPHYNPKTNTIHMVNVDVDTSTLAGKFKKASRKLFYADIDVDAILQHEEHHWYDHRVIKYLHTTNYVPLNVVELTALAVIDELASQIVGEIKNDVSKKNIKKQFKKARKALNWWGYKLQYSLYVPVRQMGLYLEQARKDPDGIATKQYVKDVKRILMNPDFNIPLFHAYCKYMFTYKNDFLLKDFSKTELLKIYKSILNMKRVNISKWITKHRLFYEMEQDIRDRFR